MTFISFICVAMSLSFLENILLNCGSWGLVLGLEYSPSASLNASFTFRVNVFTYGTMRRSVAVSNGTFLVTGVGSALASGSWVLLLFWRDSITNRALASESFRGRVMIGLGSETVIGVVCRTVNGIGDDCGPKMS